MLAHNGVSGAMKWMFASQMKTQALAVIQRYGDYRSDLGTAGMSVMTTLVSVCALIT